MFHTLPHKLPAPALPVATKPTAAQVCALFHSVARGLVQASQC